MTKPALVTVAAVTLLAGCVALPPDSDIESVDLLSGVELFDEPALQVVLPKVEILAVSDEMRTFLANNLLDTAGSLSQLENLIDTLFRTGGIEMQYDHTRTLTAAETFAKRSGNCLAYSNMMVAFARELGLRASYREVSIPPSWEESEANLFLYDNHVNVLIRGGGRRRLFDINAPVGMDAMLEFEARTISDETAFAQYYSNIGVDFLQRGDQRNAFRFFKQAILTQPEYASLWVNLGILYRRAGKLGHAEAAYYKALQLNKNDYLALTNLAALYQFMGDLERAETFASKVRHTRLKNPYYRYALAREAYESGDYAKAETHLMKAVRLQKDEYRFHLFLGLVKLKQDDQKAAEIHFALAGKLAEAADAQEKYSNKVRMLRELYARGTESVQ